MQEVEQHSTSSNDSHSSEESQPILLKRRRRLSNSDHETSYSPSTRPNSPNPLLPNTTYYNQLNQTTTTTTTSTINSSFTHLPRSNSEHSSSTTCLDSLDSHINSSSLLSPSTASNNTSPQQLQEPPHDLVPLPLPQSEYYYTPSELSVALDLPSHPPKRSWFSSRRSKRKHSIHALSTTSTSSTASLHTSPPPLDPYTSKNYDSLLSKYPLSTSSSASSSRRSSANQIKRWVKSSIGSPGPPLRWLKKSFRPRLPLGILLGLLLFISFAVSLTVFLVHYLDTDKEPLPWRTYCQEQREFPHQLADSLDPVNIFVGVFSIDSAYERRHLIRSTYARHSRPIDPVTGQVSHNVQLKFVLGKPRIQHVRRIALEMETYNDIVILDIQENMNRGKTYAFLSWASENATIPVYYHPLHEPKPKTGVNGIGGVMYPERMQTVNVAVGFKKADFVVKADDDAFIVLSELERHLRVAPRKMTYWGYLIRNLFMGGECYALSADLVNYVANSDRVLDHLTGAEDKKVAKWMRIHPNATEINWVTERCWIYDHPKAGTTYSHGFLFPDQVQRIRDEGKFGLSEAEIELRGPGRTQSHSSVIKWKERYVAPKSLMTMEEEVEALVEGGGRFSKTDWKRPVEKENLVPVEKVLFDSDDPRLSKSSIIGGPASMKSSAPLPGEFTPPVADHYREPSLKFGRPPNELMAKMPPMEDLPESMLKNKLREGMADEMSQPSILSADSNKKSTSIGGRDNESSRKTQKVQFVPSPTLRFDPEEMRIRNERFLNLSYGGTVVVHYLKRNEWFLETSLILLGRAKTWDDGLTPVVYEPSHQVRSASRHGDHDDQPTRSTIEPDGNSVVVSSPPLSPKDSKAISTIDRSSSTNNRDHPHQKKIQVSDQMDWGKFDQVEEIKVGGMFGGARMFGSPVIQNDGTISEGRRKMAKKPRPGSFSSSVPGTPNNNNDHSDKESKNVDEIQAATGVGFDQDGSASSEEGVDNKRTDSGRHRVRENEDDQKADEIRKTQFGGAGWIRGKPRLRVADPLDGPRFVDSQTQPSQSDPLLDQQGLVDEEEAEEEARGLDTAVESSPVGGDVSSSSPEEKLNLSSTSSSTTTDEDEDDQDEFMFGNAADSSLILGQHQREDLQPFPTHHDPRADDHSHIPPPPPPSTVHDQNHKFDNNRASSHQQHVIS